MGEVIANKAAAADIFADVVTTHARAVAVTRPRNAHRHRQARARRGRGVSQSRRYLRPTAHRAAATATRQDRHRAFSANGARESQTTLQSRGLLRSGYSQCNPRPSPPEKDPRHAAQPNTGRADSGCALSDQLSPIEPVFEEIPRKNLTFDEFHV